MWIPGSIDIQMLPGV